MSLARMLLLSPPAPLALAAGSAKAADNPPQAGVAGWSEFVKGLRILPD